MSLNLILGRSARAAISTLDRCQAANTLCVVSPSPRAERRMSDEDLITTFTYMGANLKRMVRMEAHFYASNFLWLPAKALTAFIEKADLLEDMLLNGVRLKGSPQDIADLGRAFFRHPRLTKITFFNIAAHRDPSKAVPEVDLLPVLEGASRNANVNQFELRYAPWANRHLGVLASPRFSQITTLVISGVDTLFGSNFSGPRGRGSGFPDLMEALKTNECLEELKICQAPGPRGTGDRVAEMLKVNKHLERLCVHIFHVMDTLPIAEAIAHDNNTIKVLEVRWPDVPQNDPDWDYDGRRRETLTAQDAYETAMLTNGSILELKLTSRTVDCTTENMKFYTRLNRAGRREILMDDDLTAEEVIDFFENNSEETDIIFHMISAKVSMLPLVVNHCSVPGKRKSAPPKLLDCDSGFSDDDDLPIKFLVSKPIATTRGKRKRARDCKTRIQAHPAKTLKRLKQS